MLSAVLLMPGGLRCMSPAMDIGEVAELRNF